MDLYSIQYMYPRSHSPSDPSPQLSRRTGTNEVRARVHSPPPPPAKVCTALFELAWRSQAESAIRFSSLAVQARLLTRVPMRLGLSLDC